MKIRCLFDELVPIQTLKKRFHPDNRNKHPEDQVKRLAEIMAYQGIRSPVKLSKQSGFVTAGHGRILAAEFNGWEEFPVNYQDYENSDQEYADVQSDNAIASWAEYDFAGVNLDIGSGKLGPMNLDLLGIRGFTVDPTEKLDPIILPKPEKAPSTRLSLNYDKDQYEIIINKLDTLTSNPEVQYSDIIFTLVMKA